MSDGCCDELEAKLQALGILDPAPPSGIWTLAAGVAALLSKHPYGAAIGIGATAVAEGFPWLADQLRSENPPDFSAIRSTEDLRQEIRTVVKEVVPFSDTEIEANKILQRVIEADFAYSLEPREQDYILDRSQLGAQGYIQGYDRSLGYREDLSQLVRNTPIALKITNLVAQYPQIEHFIDSTLQTLQSDDRTFFLSRLATIPSENFTAISDLLLNPNLSSTEFGALVANPVIFSQLVESARYYQQGEEMLRPPYIYLQNSQVGEEYLEKGQFYQLVSEDPSLISQMADSPAVSLIINQLLISPELQGILANIISNELLSGEGGPMTGALQEAVAQAVDTRLGEYGFKLPSIEGPAQSNDFPNPNTGGGVPYLKDASGQQVVPIEWFEPIDKAVADGIGELKETGQLTTENVTTTLQPIIDAALGAIETAKQNAINAIAAQHALLAFANLVLPAARQGLNGSD